MVAKRELPNVVVGKRASPNWGSKGDAMEKGLCPFSMETPLVLCHFIGPRPILAPVKSSMEEDIFPQNMLGFQFPLFKLAHIAKAIFFVFKLADRCIDSLYMGVGLGGDPFLESLLHHLEEIAEGIGCAGIRLVR
jgi:hypothetical protein